MFDPFDPGQAHDAWPLLADLRNEGAVVEIAKGMQYVTRHAECRDVLRDTETFSNASGMKAPGVVIPAEDRLLGELDPPRHTRVRRIVVTALAPKVVHAAEPFMHEAAESLFDEITGTVDLVPAFTVPFPNRVTLHLLGLDPADVPQLAAWAKELMESTFPAMNRTERGDGFAGAFPEFAGYIDAHIAKRSAELAAGSAADDVLARLLQLDDDGEPLPLRQVRALVRNLITGGFTTTSQLLGNLLHEILTDANVERALRASDDALGRAIEESLRLAPPILFMARSCVREVEISGCPITSGTRVITGFASANHDERVFDDPDEFRVDRENAEQHLTFGYGPHVCPGASLARTVARIGIRTFLDRFPAGTVRLAPDFVFENVPTYFERGPKRLPVEITRVSDDAIVAVLESHATDIGAFGLGAGVARDGSPPTFGAWGIDGRNPDTPMTPTGTFRIGSVTKTFTSAIVLDLVDRGELHFGDTIERWFPEYPHATEMSVRSLLTHTAGTADMTADAFPAYIELLLADLSRAFSPVEVIDLMAALAPHAIPGASYRYSNTDYQLLGAIAEQVSARSYAELIRELAARLDLRATTYDASIPADLEHGWFDIGAIGTAGATPQRDQDANDFPNDALITTAYAAGGMTSSLADLLAWGRELYIGGALSRSMRTQLLASPSVEDPESGRWHGFGVVGYGTRTADGSWPAYGHAGNIVGSSAFVASFPGSRTTVAIHTNIQEVPTEVLIDLAFALERIPA